MSLNSFLLRKHVPSARWVGVGTGVLVGLAAAELGGLGHANAPMTFVLAAALTMLSKIVGPPVVGALGATAAFVAIGHVVAGDSCLNVRVSPQIVTAVITAAVLAWLIAVAMASVPGRRGWLSNGFNSLILLFGLTEFATFVVSPAGVPVAAAMPAQSAMAAIVMTVGFGVFAGTAPSLAVELSGWVLALTQLFVFLYMATGPLAGDCVNEVGVSIVGAVGGGATSLLTWWLPSRT